MAATACLPPRAGNLLWLITLVGTALGLVVYWSMVAHQRQFGPHCCRRCGYDLTGNVSGICPECGTPLPSAVDAKV